MKYYDIHFLLSPSSQDLCDVLSALIADLGFESFVYQPHGLNAYIPCTLYNSESLDAVLASFPVPGVAISYESSAAPDENWNAQWEQEGFRPISIGDEIHVHDTRVEPRADVAYDICINPCQAFGTGSHQTTRLLLAHLAQASLAGKRVIDAGTGTGILAIMCSMRGAAGVLAYDIDAWSVRNAQSNAALNGVTNIEVREGDSSVLLPTDNAHFVIANINRNILLADMARFAAALLPGGQLLLSGFYTHDAEVLCQRAEELGLKPMATAQEGEWAMLVLEQQEQV